ncbi:hypothetical protein NM208_g8943 [Fusarium decemcellulare]|uniref:Uncharacterized protein n=1 Tax=Fusarium decemcellulare TaxID=57161 RepID=A0ACC1S3F8_9HYPO|nr:hypothetical protein NM208_g8943 [Fusarium decemcellulare]
MSDKKLIAGWSDQQVHKARNKPEQSMPGLELVAPPQTPLDAKSKRGCSSPQNDKAESGKRPRLREELASIGSLTSPLLVLEGDDAVPKEPKVTGRSVFEHLTKPNKWIQPDILSLLCDAIRAKYGASQNIRLVGLDDTVDYSTEALQEVDRDSATGKQEELAKGDWIVLMCCSNFHWTLAVMSKIDQNTCVVELHDSLPAKGSNSKVKAMIRCWADLMRMEAQLIFITQTCPPQPDGSSCGVYVAECLRTSLQGAHSGTTTLSGKQLKLELLHMLAGMSPKECSLLTHDAFIVVKELQESRRAHAEKGATHLWADVPQHAPGLSATDDNADNTQEMASKTKAKNLTQLLKASPHTQPAIQSEIEIDMIDLTGLHNDAKVDSELLEALTTSVVFLKKPALPTRKKDVSFLEDIDERIATNLDTIAKLRGKSEAEEAQREKFKATNERLATLKTEYLVSLGKSQTTRGDVDRLAKNGTKLEREMQSVERRMEENVGQMRRVKEEQRCLRRERREIFQKAMENGLADKASAVLGSEPDGK